MEIYAGTRREVNKGYWMSFENHPRLKETKKNIYARCLPCLEKLSVQLAGSPTMLHLESPLNCWKIVVVLRTMDECLEFLCSFQDKAPPQAGSIRGRIGTGDKNKPGIVIIFQVYNETERDNLIPVIKDVALGINPDYSLYIERGCGDLFGALCGNWQDWKDITPIKNPQHVPIIREKVNRLLRGEY